MVSARNALARIAIANLNRIANFKLKAWNVYQGAINHYVAVRHQLTCLENCSRITEPPHHGLQSKLEQAQKVKARIAVHALSFLKRVVKLLFQHVVVAANDLFGQE